MVDLQKVLADIAKAIVDKPECVEVLKDETDSTVTLTLNVDEDDKGIVIGRQGKNAKAIRTVIKAAAAGTGKKVNVDIR